MKLKPIASNMTELEVDGATVLFSYQTPVAVNARGRFYRTDKKFSVTTSRHINKWLGGAKAKEVAQEWIERLVDGGLKIENVEDWPPDMAVTY